jgi:hypothetical protein
MTNEVDLKKEEERILASINKKRNPQSLAEIKRQKDQEKQKRDKQQSAQNEQKQKQADDAKRKKDEAMQKVLQSRKETEAEEATLKAEKDRDKEREEMKQKEKEIVGSVAADAEAEKEAARMAKMFGIASTKLMTDSPVTKKKSDTSEVAQNTGLHTADDQEEREAQRMAHSFGISPRKMDSKKIVEDQEKEAKRKDLEKRIADMDTSDPKAFSRAFMSDPEVMARLKDANGLLAVNQLKGVEIPGGHTFN